jgi:hypothetical protein
MPVGHAAAALSVDAYLPDSQIHGWQAAGKRANRDLSSQKQYANWSAGGDSR